MKRDIQDTKKSSKRKMSRHYHQLYVNSILPQTPKVISFKNTVQSLDNLFGRPEKTLFSLRYKCVRLVKSDFDDVKFNAANVNQLCEDFNPADLTADQFNSND